MIRLTSSVAINLLVFSCSSLIAQSFLPQLKEKTAMLSADSLYVGIRERWYGTGSNTGGATNA